MQRGQSGHHEQIPEVAGCVLNRPIRMEPGNDFRPCRRRQCNREGESRFHGQFTSVAEHIIVDGLCADIKHKRAPVPAQTNGKVERFNRTLLEEWAYAKPYRSENERIAAFPD